MKKITHVYGLFFIPLSYLNKESLKLNHLFALIFLIFSTHCLIGQSYAKEYGILGNSKFGGSPFIIPTINKGYLVTFTSNNDSPVIKTDSLGNIEWAYKYSMNNYSSWGSTLISEAPDSGFVIPGTYASTLGTQSSISAIKINKLGNVQWTKRYGDSTKLGMGQLSATMIDGYIISGYYWDSLASETGILLVKTDFSGNLVWEKKVDFVAGASQETPKHMIITNDGGILLTIGDVGGWGDLILAKFNSAGTLLWAYQHPSIYGTEPLYVMEDNTNNIVVTGRTMSWGCEDDWDAYIMKFNSSGIFQWGKTFGDSLLPDEAYSVSQLQNGDYLVCAEVESFYAYTSQTALMRMSNTGTFQWMKLIHPDSTGSFPFNAVQNSDGGVTIARIEGSYYAVKNLSLIRTDQNILTPCTELYVTPVITTFSVSGISCGTVTSTSGEINLTVTDSAYNISRTDLCTTDGIHESQNTGDYFIYPNPFDNSCILTFDNPQNKKCTLVIYNVMGQIVRQTENIITGEVKIERADLPTGLYFFQVLKDKQVSTKGKFIIK